MTFIPVPIGGTKTRRERRKLSGTVCNSSHKTFNFQRAKRKRPFNSNMSERSFSSDDIDRSVSASGKDDPQPEPQGEAIATDETKDLFRLKLVVASVLVSSAIGVALSAYLFITWSEEEAFHAQFAGDSEKVLSAIGLSLDKTLGLMDGLAVTYVSFASYANQTWPCVTLPNFGVRMSKVVPLTDAVNINFLPIVTKKTRATWESYSRENDGWVNEAVAIQDHWDGYFGPIVYNGTHNHVIHGDFDDIPQNIR
jgi:hypothetical protein